MTTTNRHYVTHGPYGGDCSCGRTFRTSTRFGADANKAHNLAHANADRHARAANRKLDAETGRGEAMTDTRYTRDPEDPGFQAVSAPDDVEQLECLDASDPQHTCKGPVEYRDALSGTGRSFPRCDAAWKDRLDTQERLNRDYPDSSTPPAWFDESAAGERWNYLDDDEW